MNMNIWKVSLSNQILFCILKWTEIAGYAVDTTIYNENVRILTGKKRPQIKLQRSRKV